MTTPNLFLGELAPSQAQPHLVLNGAIYRLDAIVQCSCIDQLDTPPGSPTEGDRYLVGDAPTGEWVGHEQQVAASIGGGWQFFPPQPGWLAYLQSAAALYIYGTGSPQIWELLAVAGVTDAGDVNYDNATSGLISTDVQAAIDELESLIGTGGGSPGSFGDSIYAHQASDLVITSNNAFQDTDLVIELAPGIYAVEMYCECAADATPDMEIQLAFTGTYTQFGGSRWAIRGTTEGATSHHTLPAVYQMTTTADTVVEINGQVIVSVTGDLKIQARQVTSSGTSVTFYAGSWMRVTRLDP